MYISFECISLQASPYVDPYSYVEEPFNYTNICLVFAGNVELMSHTATLSTEHTSRLLEEDRIKQGAKPLFPGPNPNLVFFSPLLTINLTLTPTARNDTCLASQQCTDARCSHIVVLQVILHSFRL